MNSISLISAMGAGVGFIMFGLGMKKNAPKTNWKVFIIAGITMVMLGAIGLLLKDKQIQHAYPSTRATKKNKLWERFSATNASQRKASLPASN